VCVCVCVCRACVVCVCGGGGLALVSHRATSIFRASSLHHPHALHETQMERDRWLVCFNVALPDGVVALSPFAPLPVATRHENDHFGMIISKEKAAKYLEGHKEADDTSQGNRFIADLDL
jgi:hypothetical protein